MKDLGVDLRTDNSALDVIADRGFDPVYGARPLRRAIQSSVEDAVAEKILDGTLKAGDRALVTAQDGKITVVKE